ncbi:MAG: phosphodiester glycosidase family protein [Bacillota bacterium]
MKMVIKWVLLPVMLLIMVFVTANPVEAFTPQEKRFIEENRELRLRLVEGENELPLRPSGKVEVKSILDKETVELKPVEYSIQYRNQFKYWRVQVLATESEDRAEKVAEELEDGGFTELSIVREQNLFKLRVGKFTREESAHTAAERLREEGWSTWVDEIRRENVLCIFRKEKFVFAAPEFRLSGELTLDGDLYPGEFEFVSSGKDFSVYNTADLQTVLYGYMSGLAEIRGESYDSILRARAVAARSSLMDRMFASEQGFLVLPEYRGTGEVEEEVRAAVDSTTGEVLKKDGKITAPEGTNPILLGTNGDREDEFYLYNLGRVFVLAERGVDYQGILSTLYLDLDLDDLTREVEREERIDASVFYGLRYKEVWEYTWWGPRIISILDLDLNRRSFNVDTALAEKRIFGTGALEDMVTGNDALAGINGTFFQGDGRPLGLIVRKGKILSEPVYGRTALGINSIGKVFVDRTEWEGRLAADGNVSLKLDGVNRGPASGEAVVINSAYGNRGPDLKEEMVELVVEDDTIIEINRPDENTRGSRVPDEGFLIVVSEGNGKEVAEFSPGEKVEYSNNFTAEGWNEQEIVTALGAGPNLVTRGEVNITGEEERFQPDILYGRAPRSALGITEDRHLLLFSVDGRQQNVSVGMTLTELAEFMIDFGVERGMNLDGGDSTRMVVRGYTMNRPRLDRYVSSGIIISR